LLQPLHVHDVALSLLHVCFIPPLVTDWLLQSLMCEHLITHYKRSVSPVTTWDATVRLAIYIRHLLSLNFREFDIFAFDIFEEQYSWSPG